MMKKNVLDLTEIISLGCCRARNFGSGDVQFGKLIF